MGLKKSYLEEKMKANGEIAQYRNKTPKLWATGFNVDFVIIPVWAWLLYTTVHQCETPTVG